MSYDNELTRTKAENRRLRQTVRELTTQLQKARQEIRTLVAPDLAEQVVYSHDELIGMVTLTDG